MQKVKGHSVQQLEWKQMDGQVALTDRHEAIALPPVLTRSPTKPTLLKDGPHSKTTTSLRIFPVDKFIAAVTKMLQSHLKQF